MTIQAQISEADVPRVAPGLPAYFTILGEPERRHQASLRSIEPGPIDINSYDGRATSNNSNTAVYYNGVLDVPNADGKLRIQMTAQVNIVLRQANNVLLIPAGALGKRVKGENAPDSKNQADKPSANTASGAQAASPASSSSSSSSRRQRQQVWQGQQRRRRRSRARWQARFLHCARCHRRERRAKNRRAQGQNRPE